MTAAGTEALENPMALSGEVGGTRCRFLLRPGNNGIGSLAGNEVALPNRSVSKRHATLIVQTQGIYLEDLGSKNGSFVNGSRLTSAWLQEGDELRFGSVRLRLHQVQGHDAVLFLGPLEAARGAGQQDDAGFAPGPEVRGTDLGSQSEQATTLYNTGSQYPRAQQWLRVLDAFARPLLSRPSPSGSSWSEPLGNAAALRKSSARREPGWIRNLSAALETLSSELQLEGCAILRLGPGQQAAVISSHGRLGSLTESDWTSPIRARSRASSSQLQGRPKATLIELGLGAKMQGLLGVLPPTAGHGDKAGDLALALWGQAAHNGVHRPLVLTLLEWLPCLVDGASPRRFQAELPSLVFPEGQVRLSSTPMQELYCQLAAAADSDLPVLLCGETGVGKEGLARLVHHSSKRRAGPFVAIHCAAIPEHLLEAELFGIESGVATGVSARVGRIAEAKHGTLFLDEIGDMPSGLQVKLLRVLQEREIQPLGGQATPIDVRVISATHADLHAAMASKAFRSDLYYRLAGLVAEVPALRQRSQDIADLAQHFLQQAVEDDGKPLGGLTLAALHLLQEQAWPGNIRQLEHCVRRLALLCPAGQVIDRERAAAALHEEASSSSSPIPAHAAEEAPVPAAESTIPDLRSMQPLSLQRLEKLAIAEALRRSDGNQSQAARILQIPRESLRRRMRRHGLLAG